MKMTRCKTIAALVMVLVATSMLYYQSYKESVKCPLNPYRPLFPHIDNYNCGVGSTIAVKDCFKAGNVYHHEPECLAATENDPKWTGLPFVENFTFNIEPKCRDYDNRQLIIYIYSKVNHFNERVMNRVTYNAWLQDNLCTKVKLLFVIGKMERKYTQKCHSEYEKLLKTEVDIYNDILQMNNIDSYYELAYKGFATIYWISKRCKLKTPFLLKMDDDMMLELGKLLKTVELLSCKYKKYQLCNVINSGGVLRMFNNKYRIPYTEYQAEYYPPYCGGHGMLMTQSTAENMYDVAKREKLPIFRIDDAYFGGLLRRKSCVRMAYLNESDSDYEIISLNVTEW